MWKILTVQIKEEVSYSFVCRGLFLEEQKRCHKGTRETGDMLFMDQHIFKVTKMQRKYVAMAYVGYKKGL